MDTLGKLFGSASRVKIMRLFLFHPGMVFDSERIRKKTRVTAATLRKELTLLQKTGFLEKQMLTDRDLEKLSKMTPNGAKKKRAKKPKEGYRLAPDFPFIDAFRSIMINSEALKDEVVAKKLEETGKMQLVIASGIFLGHADSRVDLFIVGDKIKKKNLENYLKALEAEIGCDLVYTVMDLEEFRYREQVHDKLVRDVLDYPHERLIDRLGL